MVNRLKSILALAVGLPVSFATMKAYIDLLIVSYHCYFDPLLLCYPCPRSPEMLRLLYVAKIAEIAVPSSFEVAHQHPGRLVLGLSIEGDDLCADLEVRNRIVVAACDLGPHRINPQKTTLGVFHYLLLFRLGRFLIGEACAFIAHRGCVFHAFLGFEEAGQFRHFRDRQEEGVGDAQVEFLSSLCAGDDVLLEFVESFLESLAGELRRRGVKLQGLLLGLEDFFLLEGSYFCQFGVSFNDDLAPQFLESLEVDRIPVRQFLTEEEDLLEKVLQEDVGYFVPVFLLSVVLNGEDDGVMVGTAFQELGDVLDRLLEVYRLAEGGIDDCVVDDRHISVVVDVYLHAFQSSSEVLQVAFYLAVAGELVAAEVGVMRGVAKIVSQWKVLIDLQLFSRVVELLVLKEGAEFIEVYVFVHGPGCDLRPFCGHLLLSHQKAHKMFILHELFQVIQMRSHFGLRVLLKDPDEGLTAMKDLEIIANLSNGQL